MTKLTWDTARPYDAGVDRGVLYSTPDSGVVWNGLVSVNEASVGGDPSSQYYDGKKYSNSGRAESFAATLEAFSYPEEFEQHDGLSGLLTQQSRRSFGLSYRTMAESGRYKIHLVYNAMAAPSSSTYLSLGESVEPSTFTWGISTTPIPITGAKSSAHLIIDTAFARDAIVEEFEDIIYGTDTTTPRLPTPDEIIDFFESFAILRITDHGDGTWSADAPGAIITMTDPTTFQITWPSAVFIDDVSYNISSL